MEFSAGRMSLTESDQEETHHLVTGVEDENPYCSPGTSSGKQTKASFTNQPQFRSETIPPLFETDQVLVALQQLATNSNSANFNNNINRISKLLECLTATVSTFYGKSEKFQLFEYLFQKSLSINS